ncbi:MAG: tRNA epoxyqueuosine(34) reductase QueG [Gemmatimonadales bacterium]
MTDAASLAGALEQRAREEGFALVGITSIARSEHMGFYRAWLEAGRHGEMGYLARPDAVRRRADPSETMAEARSCLVVAHEYGVADPPGVPEDRSRAVIARYARGRDYHDVMLAKLEGLLAWLDERVEGGVRGRAYVDTGPLLERELASRAGLGWFGKNTVLIHPSRGSWFFIGVLMLDLELPAAAPFTDDRCGSCTACLEACPTGALLGRDERGAPVIDARRCISYLTIELRGAIPAELRAAIGNRVFGCDICQEVCPWNERFAQPTREAAYLARPELDGPSLVALAETLLAAGELGFRKVFEGSPVLRAKRAGLLRNVCVALGNWASQDAIPPLARALGDENPLVRSHAAWALGRIGSEAALAALREAAGGESHGSVTAEIRAALGPSDLA